MKKQLALLFSCLTALSGCSTTRHDAEIIEAQAEVKTLVVSCEDCKGLEIEYRSPTMPVQLPTNIYDMGIAGMNTIGSLASTAAPFWVLGQAVRYAAHSGNTTVSDSYNQSSASLNSQKTDQNFSYSNSQRSDVVTTTRTTSETPLFFLSPDQSGQGE